MFFSAVDFHKKKTPHLLEKTFPDVTSPELHLTDKASGEKGTKGSTGELSNPPDSPDFNLTWSIRREVERLMKDQNKHESNTLTQTGAVKKQRVRNFYC